MQFNTQRGATTQGRAGQGWNQSLAVQAGIGSGLQSARLREQRSQHEQTLQQSQEQFDIKMGWEKSKFKMEQAEREKQSDYQKKRGEKAERIGMFNTAIEFGKLTYMMNEEGIGADLGFGGGGPAKAEGGSQVQAAPASQMKGGDADVDATESAGGTGEYGESGGRGQWDTFKSNWMGWAAGSATGGMAGSYVAQAVFGEGKTQSTAGGAAGGAIGGYYGSGGSGYGAAGGALVGGILGYLLG